MAAVSFKNVRKSIWQIRSSIPGHSISIFADGEFVCTARTFRLWQDNDACACLPGLEQPTSRRDLMIGNRHRSATTLPPAKRDIAMVFQSYALYPHLTVAREHCVSAEKAWCSPKQEWPAMLNNIAQLLQLEPLLDEKAEAAFGRPAAARRAWPCARSANRSAVPAGRTAVESRRQVARAYAGRADRAASAHGYARRCT